MRTQLSRLIGATTIAALALTAPGVAPSAQADDTAGTIALNVVDDHGAPVAALVSRVGSDGVGAYLGEGAYASTFSEPVPADTYGFTVVGGWGGLTCVALTQCSWAAIQGEPTGTRPTPGAPAVTVGHTTPVTATVQTPKVAGSGVIGAPLTVTVAPGLTNLANAFSVLFSSGSPSPGVTWSRNGVPIPGTTGFVYTPGPDDAGSSISAVVTYPPALTNVWGSDSVLVPAPYTTAGVRVVAPVPAVRTPRIRLSVPARITKGKRPKAYVTVKDGARAVKGIVKLQVGKRRAQRVALRSGLATFTLPKLGVGRFVVRATYTGTPEYRSVAATTKIVVKVKKRRR